MEEVLKYMSLNIRKCIFNFIKENEEKNIEIKKYVQEIRIRNNRKITLKIENDMQILDYIVNTEDILETFEKICENSVYSYKKEICEGFITIKGRT